MSEARIIACQSCGNMRGGSFFSLFMLPADAAALSEQNGIHYTSHCKLAAPLTAWQHLQLRI